MKLFSSFFLSQLVLTSLFSFHLVYAMPDCIKENAVFQLHYLNKGLHRYKDTYQNLTDALLSEKIVDLRRDSLFCLTEEDIDLYNWPSQTLFLNQNYIRKLKKLKQVLKEPRQLEELKKSSIDDTIVFLLVFKGSRMYGGAIDWSYAAGYNVPTLFFGLYPDGRVIITIRPLKTLESQMTGYSSLDESLKQIIEKTEIRDFFLKLGKLTHHDDPNCVKGWLPRSSCYLNLLK